ncbi:hypothetical protein EJV46_16080 [Roseococcus sp. SYP-B2431]|uniref:hypothetical protein n=1 Tax=Roseococcus sp. SYP-B2431 TaxID=2496640 RepID=UPI00103D975A|nr:hypothetical protein [Roseococcus sp. SYP-B2431]TCH97636.1 hypothetical protein EJV46_16080 [Roseococcus sp. SYP-B2431]
MRVATPKRTSMKEMNALETIVFRVLFAVECERACARQAVDVPFVRAMATLEKHGGFLREPPPASAGGTAS